MTLNNVQSKRLDRFLSQKQKSYLTHDDIGNDAETRHIVQVADLRFNGNINASYYYGTGVPVSTEIQQKSMQFNRRSMAMETLEEAIKVSVMMDSDSTVCLLCKLFYDQHLSFREYVHIPTPQGMIKAGSSLAVLIAILRVTLKFNV